MVELIDDSNGAGPTNNGSAPVSPEMNAPAAFSNGGASKPNRSSASDPRTDEVLYSNIGITTLLDRLKQSIASTRDFAQFLKKRSNLEEEQAKGLKRLTQAQLENVKRTEMRGGSYAHQLGEVLRVHERMADNGMQFALSLHQMHEDLDLLSANMERGRKQWKHEGLDAEKRAADAEQAMQKAKARYDSLAEDYDRARTGDTKAGRRLGLKGPKSAEQHEQDLLKKTQAADADYEEKVRGAKSQREWLLSDMRPKAVRALLELIRESDSALTLQLQKFATFNEKLLLGNGLAVTPLSETTGPAGPKSLRDMVSEIDNDVDFHHFVAGHASKVSRPSEIKYEQHPTLAPKTQQPRAAPPATSHSPLAMNPTSGGGSSFTVPTLGGSTFAAPTSGNSQPGSASSRFPQTGGPSASAPYAPYSPADAAPPSSFAVKQSHDPISPVQRAYDSPAAPPYPQHPSERSLPNHSTPIGDQFSSPSPHNQTTGSIPVALAPGPRSPSPSPAHRVFATSLDDLFARDASAVPMLVFQCIQAIDLFGLGTEGIYRAPGTGSQVTRLRNAFDTLPPNHPSLDFRNPANFGHDVNSVASLLKSFFRELPDPLFTRHQYSQFIDAARHEDPGVRRDALHQGINDLPDPNYATLRALVLHLHRVMGNEERTRMGSGNLAVCFAPTLMGNHTGPQISDGALQQRVVETILANATAIFDED
ncbi:unnamed protein product [Zymoseptoria tritici ST99CH_3D7]|uniref:Rho-GAP domain-containing protein n=2 Tax=Zymoseptoria tritici TaxID=1047171 RepID=A0A1X7S9T2_ZYMT9|nr:unnamed protein product [Zymoseptoria tritici ST99CH_3D7]SMR61997.1 unnamed protein product [Zymoseptoria tritici ST99CH_1E4]